MVSYRQSTDLRKLAKKGRFRTSSVLMTKARVTKFWADLTKNQPANDLKQLLEDRRWNRRSRAPNLGRNYASGKERVRSEHHFDRAVRAALLLATVAVNQLGNAARLGNLVADVLPQEAVAGLTDRMDGDLTWPFRVRRFGQNRAADAQCGAAWTMQRPPEWDG